MELASSAPPQTVVAASAHTNPAATLARSAPGAHAGERAPTTATIRQGRGPVSEALLLRLAQDGDRVAERRLIERYEPLVRQISSAFFLQNGESSDLLQAARIGLWHAIRGWDPARGSNFRAFAAVIMRREVMLLVTASRTRNQSFVNQASSLDGSTGPEYDGAELSLVETLAAPARDAHDPAALALSRERLALILAALPSLSDHERGALRLTLDGLSHIEVGAELGGGARSVNNALQRARRKLSAPL